MALWQRYLIRMSCGLMFGALVILPLTQPAVHADVGIQPILPGGSSIKPGDETPIQMASEVVTINVRQATEADNALIKLNAKIYGYDFLDVWFRGIAEVQADFTMRNPKTETVNQTVWFPLASALDKAYWSSDRPGEIVPRLESFQVSVDGKPLNFSINELPNPHGADQPPLPWASFPVNFPAGKDTAIHVSYSEPLQSSVKGYELALYYVFQTGAGWAGPIGRAELILNLPYPASVETMAGMQQNLSLPPMYLPKPAGLPAGVILEGNQARWIWTNFEPGPQNDFEIWLLQPQKWQELENARAAVQVDPQNGQAWLSLAYIYHSLSLSYANTRLLFSPAYLQPCIDAYKKAAQLLPEHPVPHAALGLFALEPYLADQNAPAQVIDYVKNELQTAEELEAKDFTLTDGALVTSWDLTNALYDYYYNNATATVEAATREAVDLTKTGEATINYATLTVRAFSKSTNMALYATSMNCWATAGVDCSATPVPSSTDLPSPTLSTILTPSPTATQIIISAVAGERIQIIITLLIILGLLFLGFLIAILSKGNSNRI